jgi:hypothetical protein
MTACAGASDPCDVGGQGDVDADSRAHLGGERSVISAVLALALVPLAEMHLIAAELVPNLHPDGKALVPIAIVRADAQRLDDPAKATVLALMAPMRTRSPLALIVVTTRARGAMQDCHDERLGPRSPRNVGRGAESGDEALVAPA